VRHQTTLFAIPAAAIPLIVYLLTLCPTVFVGDSGELGLAATNLEIAHPPGYPLLTLIGHLWTDLFFFLRPIVALNLLSALCAALTSLMVFLSVSVVLKTLEKKPGPGFGPHGGAADESSPQAERSSLSFALAAGCLVAFGQTLWSVATNFEVYALGALLFSAALYCWVQFLVSGHRRWMFFGCYLFGLILTNHFSAVVLAPLPLIILLTRRYVLRVSDYALGILLLLLPLAVYLYLPIRSHFDLVLDWYNPETWFGFKQHVLAQTYRQRYVVAPQTPDVVPFLTQFWLILGRQWILPLVLLAVPGIILTMKNRLSLGLGLIAIVLFNVVLTFPYSIIDIGPYYLPTIIVAAIWIVSFLAWVSTSRIRAVRLTAPLLALALAGFVLFANFKPNDNSDHRASELHGLDLFSQVPEDGLLFCASDASMFPSLYLRYAENRRPDIEVHGVLSTLIKLRRDLSLTNEPGYNSLPPLLRYAFDNVDRPLVVAREPLQSDPVRSLIDTRLWPEILVSYADSADLIQVPSYKLDWRNPPHLHEPKEVLLYARYYLLHAEAASGVDSVRLIHRAIEMVKDTQVPILQVALATYLVDTENLTETVELAESAMKLPNMRQRQRAGLLALQGKAYLGLGDRWSAQRSLEKSLSIDPTQVPARVMLLVVEAEDAVNADNLGGAISRYQEIIELDPANPRFHYQLGLLYLRAGQRDLAEQEFAFCQQHDYKRAEIEKLLSDYDSAP
jgi:tetratricopeptide (TPR) repeat protein